MTDPALGPCDSDAIFIKVLLYSADVVQGKMFLLLLFKHVTSTEKCKLVFCFMILLISCTVHNVYYQTLEFNFIVVFHHVQLGGASCTPVNAEFCTWSKC